MSLGPQNYCEYLMPCQVLEHIFQQTVGFRLIFWVMIIPFFLYTGQSTVPDLFMKFLFPSVQLFSQPGMVWVDRGANAQPSQLPLSPDWWTPVKYGQSHSKSRHIHKGSLILFSPIRVWTMWWQCMPSNQEHSLENYASFTSVSEPAFWSAFSSVPSGHQIIDPTVNFWLIFLIKRTML